MTKIDWNKPIQIMFNGKWRDVYADGTISPDPIAHPAVRNKPELRYVWANVYNDTPYVSTYNLEERALVAKDTRHYKHTLKINIDTGETEKVYL